MSLLSGQISSALRGFLLGGLAVCGWAASSFSQEEESKKSAGEVSLYSLRHLEADKACFDRFTEATGIKVNVVKGGTELIERLKNQGSSAGADLLITTDAGLLVQAKEDKLLRSVSSETLATRIPEGLRDPEGYWYGLTLRARVIAYAKDRVDPAELSTYEALADPVWRGRIIARSSSSIHNQSLLASLVAHIGEEKATGWATAVRKNMARPPQGSDRDQMRAVSAGLADIAIVHTYYLGLLQHSAVRADQKVGQNLGIFYPNQDGRGTHINVAGAGVTRHARNPENALKLLEFLVSEESQTALANTSYEHPVNPKAEWSSLITSWGALKADELDLTELRKNREAALRAFEAAGWE